MTVQGGGSYSYLWGPAMAFVVIGFLALVLRWAYSSKRDSLLSRRTQTGSERDYGLLVPVAAPASAAEGVALRNRLRSAGIAGTLVETDSGLRVMVWPADLPRARGLLPEDPSPS